MSFKAPFAQLGMAFELIASNLSPVPDEAPFRTLHD